MDWLHALILGLVQGCTEFVPISSSAHLKILKTWLGIPTGEETIFFDLACHMGTLVALILYFRQELYDMLMHQRSKMVPFMVALVPLIPAYFLLKPLRIWASQPHFLGFCLFLTSLILFCAATKIRSSEGIANKNNASWKDALWIGSLQSLALVPGISRSASTIAGGLWRGWNTQDAVRFSFILSIPAVTGGLVLELLKAREHSTPAFDGTLCIIGFMTSAIVGGVVIGFAIPLLEKGLLRPFAWYCLIVSFLLTVVR